MFFQFDNIKIRISILIDFIDYSNIKDYIILYYI